MLKDPGTRRTVAVIGLLLGTIFVIGVLWSVLSGQTEWWAVILLLPAGLIIYRLYVFWIK